jgi:hypothetical protein
MEKNFLHFHLDELSARSTFDQVTRDQLFESPFFSFSSSSGYTHEPLGSISCDSSFKHWTFVSAVIRWLCLVYTIFLTNRKHTHKEIRKRIKPHPEWLSISSCWMDWSNLADRSDLLFRRSIIAWNCFISKWWENFGPVKINSREPLADDTGGVPNELNWFSRSAIWIKKEQVHCSEDSCHLILIFKT